MKKQYMFALCLSALVTLPAFQSCKECCNHSHKKTETSTIATTTTPEVAPSEVSPLETEVPSEK